MQSKEILKTIVSKDKDGSSQLRDILLNIDGQINYSNDSIKYLNVLTHLMSLIGIDTSDANETNICVGITLKLMGVSLTMEKERLKHTIDVNIKEINCILTQLRDEWSNANAHMKQDFAFTDKSSQKIKFYDEKLNEYNRTVKDKENQLNRLGFVSSITEEAFRDIHANISDLKEKLLFINTRLEEYKSFDPTDDGIRKKINEMKNDSEEYEKYFNRLSM